MCTLICIQIEAQLYIQSNCFLIQDGSAARTAARNLYSLLSLGAVERAPLQLKELAAKYKFKPASRPTDSARGKRLTPSRAPGGAADQAGSIWRARTPPDRGHRQLSVRHLACGLGRAGKGLSPAAERAARKGRDAAGDGLRKRPPARVRRRAPFHRPFRRYVHHGSGRSRIDHATPRFCQVDSDLDSSG